MVVGEFTEDVDVVILGGGPAGYSAAFALARGGRSPIVVDTRGDLGGTCLHAGCIGSKTLLHELCSAGASLDQATERAAAHVATLAKGLDATARSLGVRVLKGTARFADRRTVQVAGESVGRLRFKRAIICTGGWRASSDATVPAIDVLQDPSSLKGSVCVLGNSTDAMELAAMAAAAGCTVTLACGDALLPEVPDTLVRHLKRTLQRELTIASDPVDADLTIDATGGSPDCSALDLHSTQAACTAEGWIKVDEQMRTADTRILAAGRCTGRSLRAGAALRMGAVAASTILEGHDAFDPAVEPVCAWTIPGLTWCGPPALDGLAHVIVPWGHSGQAVLRGEAATGRTMLAWDPVTGIVHGAGAIGVDAAEHAEAFTLAVELAATIEDLAACTPAHPTKAELLGETARQAIAT